MGRDWCTAECKAALVSIDEDICETCVGYFSPEGHDHNDNCMTRIAFCANGGKHVVSLRRSCPACTWKGKAECWCHGGAKLDAWPDLPGHSIPRGTGEG
jgi:hypothetical protein